MDAADALSSIYNIDTVTFMINKKDNISYDILSKYIGIIYKYELYLKLQKAMVKL